MLWFNCVLALNFLFFCFNKDKVKPLYKRMAFFLKQSLNVWKCKLNSLVLYIIDGNNYAK